MKLVKPKTAAMVRRQRDHKPGKVGSGAALVGLKGLWAVVQPIALALRAQPGPLPAEHPARVSGCPSPAAQPVPRMSRGILGLLAGRGLWWAGWWRLGTAEDSREQDMPTSCGAGRSLNACFDGLGCLRLPKIFHSREIIFGDL